MTGRIPNGHLDRSRTCAANRRSNLPTNWNECVANFEAMCCSVLSVSGAATFIGPVTEFIAHGWIVDESSNCLCSDLFEASVRSIRICYVWNDPFLAMA